MKEQHTFTMIIDQRILNITECKNYEISDDCSVTNHSTNSNRQKSLISLKEIIVFGYRHKRNS